MQQCGIKVKEVTVADELRESITYQTHCFGKLLSQRELFRQFDLSFLTLHIAERFHLDTRRLVLAIPWDFDVDELIEYLEQWKPPISEERAPRIGKSAQ